MVKLSNYHETTCITPLSKLVLDVSTVYTNEREVKISFLIFQNITIYFYLDYLI